MTECSSSFTLQVAHPTQKVSVSSSSSVGISCNFAAQFLSQHLHIGCPDPSVYYSSRIHSDTYRRRRRSNCLGRSHYKPDTLDCTLGECLVRPGADGECTEGRLFGNKVRIRATSMVGVLTKTRRVATTYCAASIHHVQLVVFENQAATDVADSCGCVEHLCNVSCFVVVQLRRCIIKSIRQLCNPRCRSFAVHFRHYFQLRAPFLKRKTIFFASVVFLTDISKHLLNSMWHGHLLVGALVCVGLSVIRWCREHQRFPGALRILRILRILRVLRAIGVSGEIDSLWEYYSLVDMAKKNLC